MHHAFRSSRSAHTQVFIVLSSSENEIHLIRDGPWVRAVQCINDLILTYVLEYQAVLCCT